MGYDISVSAPMRRTLIELRGDKAALSGLASGFLPEWPERPCHLTRLDKRALLWLGPACWQLMAPPDEEDRLAEVFCAQYLPDAGAMVLSDTTAFITVAGRDAEVAMAIACPLDLHADTFGIDACMRTDAFGLRVLVMRENGGWLLGVEAACAPYVTAQLAQII